MKQEKNTNENKKASKENKENVRIKYDVITPDDRDPQPKAYDEIEY